MPSFDALAATSPAPRSPAGALSDLRRRLHGRWVLHRRWLVALALGVAVLSTIRALAPPPPPQVSVVAAARDLDAERPLSEEDLVVRQVPEEVSPSGALSRLEEGLGRMLAGPLRAGEVLTDRRVVGPGLLAAHPGAVAVPVRLADPGTQGLLRVGDVVDLVAASPRGRVATVVAHAVPVIALPRPSRRDSGGLAAGAGGLLVAAVQETDALRVAQASAADVVGVIVLG